MLDTRVFSLGVFPDQHLIRTESASTLRSKAGSNLGVGFPHTHRIDIIVRRLVPLYRDTWSDIRKQAKRPPQSQIERNVTLADRRRERSLESDSVLFNGVDGFLRDGGFTIYENWSDVDFFPFDRGLRERERERAAARRVSKGLRSSMRRCMAFERIAGTE